MLSINLTDPRAMPLEEFPTETIAALDAGDVEAYAVRARERRDAQRTSAPAFEVMARPKISASVGRSCR